MLIRLIEEQSEEHFLETLEETNLKTISRGILLCSFSKASLTVSPDDILIFLKDILTDHKGELYFCQDGDLAICWVGKAKEILEKIIEQFIARYPLQLSTTTRDEIFRFYDTHIHGEDLRLMFREKLHKRQEIEKQSAPPVQEKKEAWKPAFSEDEKALLKRAIYNRAVRKDLKILIVEDQKFSRRLLAGLLERQYFCYTAETAEQGVRLYAEHAPNVVFLDVELPDASGHDLAALFRKNDNGCYAIMVTSNNYAKDVETARANKVQGFIVKPYQKQRILTVIEAYKKRRK